MSCQRDGADSKRLMAEDRIIPTMASPQNLIDPVDGYDLREYRDAAATFVRLMIRARAKEDPKFLDGGGLAAWRLQNITAGSESLERLLMQADAAFDRLWRVFIGPHGSGGVCPDDPRAELKEPIVHFMFATQPVDLLDQLRQGKKIKWNAVARRDTLPAIRMGLNSLPAFEPARAEHADCPALMGSKSQRTVYLNGETEHLTSAQWDVINALVNVYPETMSKDELVAESTHGDAVNTLKRLANSDAWKRVIHLAGGTGGGYGILQPQPPKPRRGSRRS